LLFCDIGQKIHIQQVLKDPYIFDFLGISEKNYERKLEQALLTHLKNFLLELGVGFSFVGSQYHSEIRKWLKKLEKRGRSRYCLNGSAVENKSDILKLADRYKQMYC